MKASKEKRLKRKGWRVGTAKDFLGLTAEETAYVELKHVLSRQLREAREGRGLTQQGLADRIGSSQSRIAKAEANDPGVSIDLLVRALFAAGVSRSQLGKLIAAPNRNRAA